MTIAFCRDVLVGINLAASLLDYYVY